MPLLFGFLIPLKPRRPIGTAASLCHAHKPDIDVADIDSIALPLGEPLMKADNRSICELDLGSGAYNSTLYTG